MGERKDGHIADRTAKETDSSSKSRHLERLSAFPLQRLASYLVQDSVCGPLIRDVVQHDSLHPRQTAIRHDTGGVYPRLHGGMVLAGCGGYRPAIGTSGRLSTYQESQRLGLNFRTTVYHLKSNSTVTEIKLETDSTSCNNLPTSAVILESRSPKLLGRCLLELRKSFAAANMLGTLPEYVHSRT